MAQSGGLRRWNTLLGNHFPPRTWCSFAVSARTWTAPEPIRNYALRCVRPGMGGSLGRHLILTSPVLRRLRGNRFALVRFTERGATR